MSRPYSLRYNDLYATSNAPFSVVGASPSPLSRRLTVQHWAAYATVLIGIPIGTTIAVQLDWNAIVPALIVAAPSTAAAIAAWRAAHLTHRMVKSQERREKEEREKAVIKEIEGILDEDPAKAKTSLARLLLSRFHGGQRND